MGHYFNYSASGENSGRPDNPDNKVDLTGISWLGEPWLSLYEDDLRQLRLLPEDQLRIGLRALCLGAVIDFETGQSPEQPSS